MRTPIFVVTLFILLISTSSCEYNRYSYLLDDFIVESISRYEESFKERSDSSYNGIFLVGYKTIPIPPAEQEEFMVKYCLYEDDYRKESNLYYSPDGSFLRVYFPMHTAIASVNGKNFFADENGYIEIPFSKSKDLKIKIVGRLMSDVVRGTGTNKIKNGQIKLKNNLNAIRVVDNMFFFDTGERIYSYGSPCCPSGRTIIKSSSEPSSCEEDKVSCYQNHNNMNCSITFNINEGRCEFDSIVCMDYNGLHTDCINGKLSNFPKSDCYMAVKRGHCWNEIKY